MEDWWKRSKEKSREEPGHDHYLSWLCAYELCVRHADESPAPTLIHLDPTKILSVDRKGIGDRLKISTRVFEFKTHAVGCHCFWGRT